jgi:hypothetical protein
LTALLAKTPPDNGLLARIREHMQQRLSKVPNYTCRETIERAERRGTMSGFMVMDTMLLEVAQVGGRELLAWPGGRFEAKPLSAFATSGLMSNGAFAMHARALFFGDRATWKYGGERIEEGRKLVRFDFVVLKDKSGYRVRSASGAANIPYHGFILADPQTLDVARIEVFSDSIPRPVGMERADMVIEYQRARIGASDALLPRSATVVSTLRDRKVKQRNRIEFSGCRQYGSESVISFLPENVVPQAEEKVGLPGAPEIRLPEGTHLVLRLAAGLDSANTPVGSRIQAVVDEDVRDGERVLMPKGAKVSGRVRTLSRVVRGGNAFEVGLEFTQAEWDGGWAQFSAGLEEVEPGTVAQLTLSSFADESTDSAPIGTFYVRGKAFTLPLGFRTVWRILPK